jgi:hypothetical protein
VSEVAVTGNPGRTHEARMTTMHMARPWGNILSEALMLDSPSIV